MDTNLPLQVGVVEDNKEYVDYVQSSLSEVGIEMLFLGDDLDKVLKYIEIAESLPRIVCLDGVLGNQFGAGKKIGFAIKAKFPEIILVNISSDSEHPMNIFKMEREYHKPLCAPFDYEVIKTKKEELATTLLAIFQDA